MTCDLCLCHVPQSVTESVNYINIYIYSIIISIYVVILTRPIDPLPPWLSESGSLEVKSKGFFFKLVTW